MHKTPFGVWSRRKLSTGFSLLLVREKLRIILGRLDFLTSRVYDITHVPELLTNETKEDQV